MRPGPLTSTSAATKATLRTLARRWQQLQAELDQLDCQLQALVAAAAPTLLALPGVGVDTAGQLLVTAGDNPQRLRSEAAFAQLCGAAPIPASSGRTDRHRLNRGGDRHTNNALWRIALVRMHCHPPTRASVERRTTQGLSKLDILRGLKRYIARELYQHLTSPPPTAPPAGLKQEASKLTSTDTTERNTGMLRVPLVAALVESATDPCSASSRSSSSLPSRSSAQPPTDPALRVG